MVTYLSFTEDLQILAIPKFLGIKKNSFQSGKEEDATIFSQGEKQVLDHNPVQLNVVLKIQNGPGSGNIMDVLILKKRVRHQIFQPNFFLCNLISSKELHTLPPYNLASSKYQHTQTDSLFDAESPRKQH